MPTEKLPHGADPRGKLYPEPRERWRDENREALASINVFVDEHGLLASRLRYRPAGEALAR